MLRALLPCLLLVAGCGETPRGGGGSGGGGEEGDRASRTTCAKVETVEVEGRFEVFKYEANRPNATEEDHGTGEDLPACSEKGVLPWVDITNAGAQAACERSGFSLCTETEWLLACGGRDHQRFPYGEVLHKGYCNEHQGGLGRALPSGSKPYCRSPDGTYDVVGNVWEWISTPGNGGEVRYLGYSYKVSAIRPTADPMCDSGLQTGEQEYDRPEVGFRCCGALD